MKITIKKDIKTKELKIQHDCKNGDDFSEIIAMLEFAKLKLFINNEKNRESKNDSREN